MLARRAIALCPLALALASAVGQLACVRTPRRASIVPPSPVRTVTDDDDEAEALRRSTEWFNRRHPDGGLRLKAVEEKNRLAPTISATSGQWNTIGPQPIEWGLPTSGRVWGIGVDPRNSGVIYVGTDGGGVWKSTNGGTNWLPLTDSQANINIRDLTLAPTRPDTLFAATTGGLLKSTNGGASWTTSLPSSFVNSISVHPADASVVLIAAGEIPAFPESIFTTSFDVSRSADGGSTWSTTLSNARVTAVVFDPTNGNVAYATSATGLYRSTDSGFTWNPVAGLGLPAGPFHFMSVAIAPSSSNILFLTLQGFFGDFIGFYRSADSGATWTQIAAPAYDAIPYWGWSLRVHPTNPNIIYAGSLGLSMSTDGGRTWITNENGLHVDHHVQVYSADGNTLYIGCDGGIWRTTTPTLPNASWTSLNDTLNTAMFYPGISINPSTPNIAFGGTQDNGVVQYQGNLPWRQVVCGDGGYTAIDFLHPQNVYASCAALIEVTASTDGGDSFHYAQNGIDIHDPIEFLQPLVMDPSKPSRLYYGTNRVYQTVDGAGSWTAISPDLSNQLLGGGISTIAVAPSDPNTVYTGASSGVLFITQNALSGARATWTARNLPAGQDIFRIAVDPQKPLTAWAAGSGRDASNTSVRPLYRTTDGGLTWIGLSAGLPSLPVNDIVLDPDVADTIYAATDIGVYRSVDAGQSWLPLGTGLPNVVVNALLLYRPTRTLRAATYGRGMWDLSVPASGQVAITIASTSAGSYFSLEDGTTYQAPFSFYWFTKAQHTVTWLNTAPAVGTRFVFSGWSDGASQNARTIVVPSSAATYNATVDTQYLLTVTPSPAQAGAVTLNPPSTDGYYNAGTRVQIDATAVADYYSAVLSGDLTGSPPQSIAMNAPHHVTVTFTCGLAIGYFPQQLGSGSTSGFFQIHAGANCPWNLAPRDSWFTLTSASSGVGPATVAYTVEANTGATRSTTLFGALVTQDAGSTGRPAVVSMLPNSGNGITQSFTWRFQDPNGYSKLAMAFMYFARSQTGGPQCVVLVQSAGSQYTLYLLGDTVQASAQLPATTILQNGQCSLDAGQSSVSGSGNFLNVTIALTFKSSFSGDLIATASATDSVSNISSFNEMVGTWVAYPAAATPPVVVSSVANGASYRPPLAPNTWITIQGSNLAKSTRQWGAADFVNGRLPKSLDGVSVTIDGNTAFVYYISPTQINVLSPDGTRQGAVPVVVSNSSGTSNAFSVSQGSVSPAFFTFDSAHVAATHAGGSDVGAPDSIPGVTTTPAVPGETVILYGTGFGATDPPVATGIAATGVTTVASPVEVSIGGAAAIVSFAGLIAPGLYQLNVVIPNVSGGDLPIVATIAGAQSQTGVVITIQQ